MRRRHLGRRILGKAGLLGMAALLMGSTIAVAAGGYTGGYNFWNNGGGHPGSSQYGNAPTWTPYGGYGPQQPPQPQGWDNPVQWGQYPGYGPHNNPGGNHGQPTGTNTRDATDTTSRKKTKGSKNTHPGSGTGTGSKKSKGSKGSKSGSRSGSKSGSKSTGSRNTRPPSTHGTPTRPHTNPPTHTQTQHDPWPGQLRHVLLAWLQHNYWAFQPHTMIDTDGDCTPDTTFKAVLYEIKSIANNPNSSTADLERAKALTEAVADHANGYQLLAPTHRRSPRRR